ncbi:MAG: hypothetical protein QXU32_02410 [Nitrososphaerales archaeon]
MMLATGWSQRAVMRHWNAIIEAETGQSNYFNHTNVWIHANRHLSVRDAAIKNILEERARLDGIDIKSVEGFIRTKAGTAEAIISSGLESLYAGQTIVEPKIILDAIRVLMELEEKRASLVEEEMLREIKAFMAAVKRVVPEDMWSKIYEEFEIELERTKTVIDYSLLEPMTIDSNAEEEDIDNAAIADINTQPKEDTRNDV